VTATEWRNGVEVEPHPARRVRTGWVLLVDGSLWAVDDAHIAVSDEPGAARKAEMHLRNVTNGAVRTVYDEPATTVYKVVAGGEG
jgi:translation elongation factor P/translation initiation factor 5A